MEDFVNQLLADANIPSDLDPEVKAQLVNDLTTRAVDLINRRLIDALSEAEAGDLEKLMDEKPDDQVAYEQFITDHVPDKEQVVAAALLELRTEYLGDKA